MNFNPTPIIILLIVITLVGLRAGFGPVIWMRKASGRKRAQEGSDRRELVARVQKLLPQANDDNVVFSMYVESHTSGGSRVKVTTHTYHTRVFVVDGDHIWLVPFGYDKKGRSYTLGEPFMIPESAVKKVALTGKRGRSLTCVFYLELDGETIPVEMVLQPMCFRKNAFYPFDLFQENACQRALKAAEKLAYTACGTTAEQLEAERLKDECASYGIYAGIAGFFGIAFAAGDVLPITAILFGVSLVMFILMIAKKRFPKASLVVVILEALAAYAMLRI